MIYNFSEYVKYSLFNEKIDKAVILSDTEIDTKNKLEKFDIKEPVGQILALSKKYKYVFVVLDELNWDNIFRLYKNFPKNVCILNLNAGYTWIWKKDILADMDDIYINPLVKVLEPMDIENLNFYVENFIKEPTLTHIRVPNKEIDYKIGWEELDLDYKEIIDFAEYGISGYSGLVISYWSTLAETLNAVWLLQSEWLGVDLFWVGNYKQDLSTELIKKIDYQEKIFVVGDFDALIFRDLIYSKFFEFNLNKEIYFITPIDLKLTLPEYLSEQVKMQWIDIYNRIKDKI